MQKTIFSLILSLVILHPTYAVPHESQIEYLTINDGLSGNFITDILQDRRGYLWFGTMAGLNRYDGRSFVIFRNIPGDTNSLSDNHIKSFDQDQAGNLYIATNTGGLNRLNLKTETLKRCRLSDSSGIHHKALSSVKCDSSGFVWIGTQDGFLLHYNSRLDSVVWSTQVKADYPNKTPNSISDLYLEAPRGLWIASGLGGLDFLDFSVDTLQHVLLADTLKETFRRNGCGGIIRDTTGTFWISRVSGLDSYNPKNGAHQHFGFLDSKNEMLKSFSLVADSHGDIILSSYYDLVKFNPANHSHQVLAGILPQYFTSALYRDPDGIIWVGTMGYGVVKIDPQKGQFHTSNGNFLKRIFPVEMKRLADFNGTESLNLRDRDFLSVIRDHRGDVWAATQYWGLYHIDHLTGAVRKYYMGKPDIRQRYRIIYEVFEDHQGEIWVSTSGGLCKLNQETGVFQYRRLYPGELHLGNERDYFSLNKTNYLDISCIHQDEAGIFWLGTPELGLIRFDPTCNSIACLPVSLGTDNKGSFSILSIWEDHAGTEQILWLGTEGGGLVRFDKGTHQSTFITTQDGLPNNTINIILPGTGNELWMSTNMGLSRYITTSGQFLNFDVRDGLQSNGFNRREGYKTDGGELYFGGSYGYNHFYPENISENNRDTPIVLSGIDLLNEPVEYARQNSPLTTPVSQLDKLVLDHQQAMMVTFNYTALSYSSPHRDQFAYKLDNFDSHWIKNGTKRSAVYTNLYPGKYRFRVRHLGDIEAQKPIEFTLDLTVLPPFWKTWWFRTGGVGLFVFLLVLLIRKNFLRLEAKRIQQQHFSQQLLEYQESERKRISGELHDGVGQDLLIIKNTLQLGINALPEDMGAQKHFNSASEIVSKTIQEVREISHNLSPQHLEQLGLTSTLESVIEAVEYSSNIVFDVTLDDIDDLIPREMEILLYRIVQEGLNNIIKHSGATRVSFLLKHNDGQLRLKMSDNGIGISNTQISERKGIGLAGMYERAHLLNAILEIKPGKSKGTIVHLVIDLKEEKGY